MISIELKLVELISFYFFFFRYVYLPGCPKGVREVQQTLNGHNYAMFGKNQANFPPKKARYIFQTVLWLKTVPHTMTINLTAFAQLSFQISLKTSPLSSLWQFSETSSEQQKKKTHQIFNSHFHLAILFLATFFSGNHRPSPSIIVTLKFPTNLPQMVCKFKGRPPP